MLILTDDRGNRLQGVPEKGSHFGGVLGLDNVRLTHILHSIYFVVYEYQNRHKRKDR